MIHVIVAEKNKPLNLDTNENDVSPPVQPHHRVEKKQWEERRATPKNHLILLRFTRFTKVFNLIPSQYHRLICQFTIIKIATTTNNNRSPLLFFCCPPPVAPSCVFDFFILPPAIIHSLQKFKHKIEPVKHNQGKYHSRCTNPTSQKLQLQNYYFLHIHVGSCDSLVPNLVTYEVRQVRQSYWS